MDYFKINYDKLQNMPQINYYRIVIIISLLFISLIIVSSFVKIYQKDICYGIYNNNILKLKINSELSDNIKKSEYITFNNEKTKFKIQNYGDYEIIDNFIFQEIYLIIDDKFYHNEVGKVELYYDRQSILKIILDLF